MSLALHDEDGRMDVRMFDLYILHRTIDAGCLQNFETEMVLLSQAQWLTVMVGPKGQEEQSSCYFECSLH